MRKIVVKQKFTHLGNDGVEVKFAPGIHEVSDDVADHWYVKAHSEPFQSSAEVDEVRQIHNELMEAKAAFEAEVAAHVADKLKFEQEKLAFEQAKAAFEAENAKKAK